MRIEKLIIYGFGKHENVTIDLGSGMNLLYGLNEAGKTTIQQFILHILFGFPQKNSSLLRYEPRSGGKYGGQVQVVDELFGKCTIERIRGKSAGNVTVRLEDGTSGGEDKLKELLRQFDRASFESIFSFSLLQLQGFEKMDEDELSRTLLASGTTGVDALLQVEKKFEKEMSELFKKTGKLPELNVKMEELRKIEGELKVEREKMAEYAPAVERLQEIERLLNEWKRQDQNLQEKEEQLAHVRQLQPLFEKKRALERRLMNNIDRDFPADGVRRYEIAAGKLAESVVVQQRITEELANAEAQMSRKADPIVLNRLERLLAKESEWHRWDTSLRSATEEIRRLTGAKMRLLDRLGIDPSQESILLQADVSLQREEELADWLRQLDDKEKEIDSASRNLERHNQEWNDLQYELQLLEQQSPSDKDKELAGQWPMIRQRLAEARAYLAFGNKQNGNQDKMMFLSFLAVAIICLGYGVLQAEWLILGIGVLIGGIGIYFYRGSRETSDSVKMREMENFVAAYDGQERHFEELEEKIRLYQQKKEELQGALQKAEKRCNEIENELARFQHKRQQIYQGLANFLESYGIQGMPSPSIIPELFRMSRDIQEISRELKENEDRIGTARRHMQERLEEAEAAIQKTVQREHLYEVLRTEYMRLKQESDRSASLAAAIEEQKTMLQKQVSLTRTYEDQIQKLFYDAGVDSEEQFYKAYDASQEAVLVKRQLEDILAQIAVHGNPEVPEIFAESGLEEQSQQIRMERKAISEERDHLIDEKAALLNKTETLLSDETFAQKQQLFEIKRAELAALAKKWAERRAVTEAIRRTMSELKEKKLPDVLRIADSLFHRLTNGNYTSLHVTDTGYFQAVAADGSYAPIVELSQATKEQAYIALRLALADSMRDIAPFPIILDDPFVHFDAERQSSMIAVLKEMQEKHQFIYFTCHEEMKGKWQDATILNVSELGSDKGAVVF